VAVVRAHHPGDDPRSPEASERLLVLETTFLNTMAKADPTMHRSVVVCNGRPLPALASLCRGAGVELVVRENRSMDFGAYSAGVRHIDTAGIDAWVFVNDSSAGPLHPKNAAAPFAELLELLDEGADLAGQSINPMVPRPTDTRGPLPHVQTMSFAMTARGMAELRQNFLSVREDEDIPYERLVSDHEIAMSTYALQEGLAIDCLLPPLRGIDWKRISVDWLRLLAPNRTWGGDPWNAGAWYGRTLLPSETLLYKYNRVTSLDWETELGRRVAQAQAQADI